MGVESVCRRVVHDRSFGGIPKRGAPDAIAAACRAIDGGAEYYLRSDVEDFFSNIPRDHIVEEVVGCLPDDSLSEILDDATQVELENLEELGELVEHFPSEHTGVPQGNSLSAFLGNFLLRPFDDVLNSNACVCLRYLDDFLILGPDRSTVRATFRKGNEVLNQFGLRAYQPEDSRKADEGLSRKRFEFLGREISEGFVQPSRENQRKLVQRVREKLETSQVVMRAGGFGSPEHKEHSLTTVLGDLDKSIDSWAEQFRDCNARQAMENLDKEIDQLLTRYLGVYANRKDRGSAAHRRRMLGVALLQDVDMPAAWPPSQAEGSEKMEDPCNEDV
jgi:hypothetical protein